MVLYLSNGAPFYKFNLEDIAIPSYADIRTRNPVRLADMGGYYLAHTYIEYLDVTYGWEKVMELVNTEEYEKVFAKTEEEIYEEW